MTPPHSQHTPVPLWIRLSYTAMVLVILPVYWHWYGPSNYLWFSDIALIAMVPALWLPSRLIASMMGVAVLFLEVIWMLGFFTGGRLFNIADYMFDDSLPIWLRGLSLFHFPMPAAIVYMMWKYGYDPRALKYQALLAAVVLPATRLLAPPEENINWVWPPDWVPAMPAPVLLSAMWILLVVVVYLPSHACFKRWFPPGGR